MIGVVLTAAGSSTRMGAGAPPKVLLRLGDRTVLEHALAAVREALPRAARVVTARPEDLERVRALCGDARVVAGGATRQASVLAGLAALPAAVTHVLVHDAARPLASPRLFTRTLEATLRHGAAVAGLRPADSLHALETPEGSRLVLPLERSAVLAAQTPQGARRDWLVAALERAVREGREATDEAGALLVDGHDVWAVEGEPWNVKLTRREDLPLLEAWLAQRGRSPA